MYEFLWNSPFYTVCLYVLGGTNCILPNLSKSKESSPV